MRNGDMVQKIIGSHIGFVNTTYKNPPTFQTGQLLGTMTGVVYNMEIDAGEGSAGSLTRSVDVRFPDGTCEKIERIDFENDEPITVDEQLEIVTPKLWANVYLTDREFGGHEEGGWWYDCGSVERSTQAKTPEEAESLLETEEAWCKEQNKHRRSNISSVLSEGRYEAILESWPGESYPAVARPQYS
jgi:hypothetical protein